MRFDSPQSRYLAIPLCLPALAVGLCIPKQNSSGGLSLHGPHLVSTQSGADHAKTTGEGNLFVAGALAFVDEGKLPEPQDVSSLMSQWREHRVDSPPSQGQHDNESHRKIASSTISAQPAVSSAIEPPAPPPPPETTKAADQSPPPPPATTEQVKPITLHNNGVVAPPAPSSSESSSASSAVPSTTKSATANAPNDDAQKYLDEHNKYRARHNARPLQWSEELASKSRAWAAKCSFSHESAGENIAAGGDGKTNDIAGTVKMWYDEWTSYDLNAADFTTNSKVETGHFTQLVWKDTTRLGCAAYNCGQSRGTATGMFTVCHYDPVGNVQMKGDITQLYKTNVQAKPDGS